MIVLSNGKVLTTGTGITKQSYNMRITGSVIVSILCFVKNRTDSFNYRYTLNNGQYIRCYTESGNIKVQGYNSDDTPIPRFSIISSLSNFDIPVPVFLVQEDGTQNIFLQYGSLGITSIGQLESEKPVNATLVQYPTGQPIDRTVQTYLKAYNWTDFFSGTIVNDENEIDGISGVGGGGGNFDNDSDSVGVPTLPSFNLLSSSAISVYNLTTSNLSNLSSFLFSDSFVDNIKKLFNNPIENILNLCIAPITNDVQVGGSNVIVKIGNVLATDTHADLVASQFYEIDLGTFDVDEHWGSCLDYEPYTRATLYLPYANSINLDIDKVMGCTIGVKYHCDIVTGNFIGFITSNGQVINMVNGNLKTDIALSGTDYTQKSIATLQTVTGLASTIGGVATGNAMLMGMGASNVASGVMSSKPNYTQTGSFTSASGLMGLQYAYIVFERVDQCLPSEYKAFNGYPSYITENLNNLTGFTKIADIHLSILGALDDEVAELESLLKEGVIL